jgi:hypothetical protein
VAPSVGAGLVSRKEVARRGMMNDMIGPEFGFEDALEFESKRDKSVRVRVGLFLL